MMDATLRANQPFADYLDGQSATVKRVEVIVESSELVLAGQDATPIRWRLSNIRSLPDQADPYSIVLTYSGDPLARLIVDDRALRKQLQLRCPNLNKRLPVQGRGRILGWSIGAIASVCLIIFVLVPTMANQLAEFLPASGEKALGDSTFAQIRSALSDNDVVPVDLCENPAGQAALELMQARLEQATSLPYPLSVHVLDHEMVNAFALPGGYIVIFRGLIDAAEDPDEVAAVFAHEIGHVVNRDPTRSALRTAGSIGVLGLVFGDFAGGTAVLFLVERLIQASYSQEAEAGADAFAHRTLAAQGISPTALATFFERLRDRHGDDDGIVSHLAAHPTLTARIESAIGADNQVSGPIRPSLSDAQWQDLRAICR